MPSQTARRILKARAIIINERSVGESNKQLTLLAKDLGKLVVFARGAKNQKSKFFSGAQPFCYCDFVLFDGGDFLSVTQIELIRNFSARYTDVYKMLYGSFFLELANKTVMLSQEANDVMLLLLRGLQKLESTQSPKKIAAAFQLKLFFLLGFCPEADVCILCGKPPSDGRLFYDDGERSQFDGFLCGGCVGGVNSSLKAASEGFLAALRFINAASVNGEVFGLSVSESVLGELYGFAEKLGAVHLETSLNTPAIIECLNTNLH